MAARQLREAAAEPHSERDAAGVEQGCLRRYQLPIVVIVFNNGGIYGGDRRQPALQVAAKRGRGQGQLFGRPRADCVCHGCQVCAPCCPYSGRGD